MSQIEIGEEYDNIHHWLNYHYGPAPLCIFDPSHEGRNFQWANVSGEYKKSLDDFLPMCRSCHAKFDMTDKSRLTARKTLAVNSLKIRRSVSNVDDKGRPISTYSSMSEAARAHDTTVACIWQSINKGYRTGGHRWIYS